MSSNEGYEQADIEQILIDGDKKILGRGKAVEVPEIQHLAGRADLSVLSLLKISGHCLKARFEVIPGGLVVPQVGHYG
ncbi:MAG TPA: hypothetical protein HPP94_16890 [Desulfuromonadales bacterium]|nr:hypothetical protein [Desulfuromonadales bacterium]